MTTLDIIKLIGIIATVLFIAVKLFVFLSYNFPERGFNIFMDSFAIASLMHLHMIEDPKIRQFAEKSNHINRVYYISISLIIAFFLASKYLLKLTI